MKRALLLLLSALLISLALPALADAPELALSLPSGFYELPQRLEIRCDAPDAVIYYTLDGSVPDQNALRYEGGIPLDLTVDKADVLMKIGGTSASGDFIPQQDFPTGHVVRAVAIRKNGQTSPVVSGTYFIGYDRAALHGDLPLMLLVTDPDGLFGYEQGIYVMGKVYDEWAAAQTEAFKPRDAEANYTQRGSDWERPITVTYLPAEGVGFTQDMGVRIKGDASRLYNQKSLRLVAREQYGSKNVKYELYPDNVREEDGGVVDRYKSFTLRNGGNDCDYAKIRDPFITRLAEGMHLETAQAMPCIAYINGEYWGLYTLVEEFSDNYFQYHYGVDSKNVVIVKCGELEEGEDADLKLYEEMFRFIAKQDMSDPAMYERAGKLLDLDSFADLCALHLYTGNNDGVFQYNNWQMWRVRKPEKGHPYGDGKWRVILYDSDITAGVFSNGEGAQIDNLTLLSENYGGEHPARLFTALLKNDDFRLKVIRALADIRNLYFDKERTATLLAAMTEEYLPHVPDTLRRFGPEWTQWGPEMYYADQLKKLGGYFEARWDAFMPMVQKAFALNEPCKVTIQVNGQGQVYLNGRSVAAQPGAEYLYFIEGGLSAAAIPSAGTKFTGWTVSAGAELSAPGAAATEVTFTQSITLTANFE